MPTCVTYSALEKRHYLLAENPTNLLQYNIWYQHYISWTSHSVFAHVIQVDSADFCSYSL